MLETISRELQSETQSEQRWNNYEMIVVNGRPNLLYEKYTYSRQGPKTQFYYYCSRRLALGCHSKITLNKHGEIIAASIDHRHPPPNLLKTSDGRYLKVFSATVRVFSQPTRKKLSVGRREYIFDSRQ
ncbi:uncharacterized protein LOC114239884 [Bombyx mandarina]|uniref:Uncharacterized protein LOC114239884 n=1 Tax=Bombyx mandarina TaxID=7092 RepID=A0A6J2JC73_BOMMA|nr:uncharacterized protein LOC114239884 [Bombyx mandarina]